MRIISYEVQVGNDSTADTTTQTGLFYYRLKINELNTTLYSPIITITLPATPAKLSVYPNPAVGTSQTVIVPGTTTVSSQFKLTDLNGKILRILPVKPGTSQVQMNTTGLTKGLYKLVWSDGTQDSHPGIFTPVF